MGNPRETQGNLAQKVETQRKPGPKGGNPTETRLKRWKPKGNPTQKVETQGKPGPKGGNPTETQAKKVQGVLKKNSYLANFR